VPDSEALALGAALFVVILLFLIPASIRIVREGEFLAVFRLGRAYAVTGPGLTIVIPLTDRAIRVQVPVGMVDVGSAKDPRRAPRASPDKEIPGHAGVTMAEVCFRAAMVALRQSPRTRNATAEHFQEAMRELEGRDARKAW
jgi:hypothetical protein